MLKRYLLWPLLLAWAGLVQADDMAALQAKLEKIMPGITIDSLQPLDNTGLYEGVINGEIIYFSADGRYAVQGDVVSLESRENVTENRRISLRKAILDGLNEKEMIVYGDEDSEYTLTVFTDIDCGYCRKLHQQMDEYNALGIRIRYMSFPRSGIDSDSYDKAVNVWCSDDRHEALTLAKLGEDLEARTCDNPVKKEYELGQKLGVQGTPALFLESGQMLPGYVPPKRLKQILDQQASSHS
jgi:thiol:disulfide interchange protein DsbC